MIPLTEVKAWLGITTSIHDDTLVQAESDAVATINRLIGYYFGLPETRTYLLDGTGTDRLHLSDHVAYVPGEDPYETWQVIERLYEGDPNETEIVEGATDGWTLRHQTLHRRGGYCWTVGYTYLVTYDRGYQAGTEPGDVRRAVLALLSVWWNRRGIEGGLTSESIGGYSYTIADVGDALLLSDPTIAAIIGARRRQRA